MKKRTRSTIYGINDLIRDGHPKIKLKSPITIRVNDDGYEQMINPGSGRWVLTHRYILEQIYGSPPRPGIEGHHRDTNRRNNRPANLDGETHKRHGAIHRGEARNRPFRKAKT
jgi:hypothetical protein